MATKQYISENAINTISRLNEQLFEAEYELEAQQRAVSKYRHFLSAEHNQQTALDLYGAIKNLRGKQQRVDELRKQLNDTVDNLFAL